MKNLIALGLSVLLLLAACSRSSVLKIVEQGSFAVGGTVLTDSLVNVLLKWKMLFM